MQTKRKARGPDTELKSINHNEDKRNTKPAQRLTHTRTRNTNALKQTQAPVNKLKLKPKLNSPVALYLYTQSTFKISPNKNRKGHGQQP